MATPTTTCPPGQHPDGSGGCVANVPVPTPTPTPTTTPTPTPPDPHLPTPVPGGPGPITPNNRPPACPPGTHPQWDTIGRAWRCDANEVSNNLPAKPVENAGTQDCPGGHWNNNAKECRPGPAGGGAATTTTPTVPNFNSGAAIVPAGTANVGGTVEDQIYQHVQDLLSGKYDPYSDERLNAMKGQLFSATQGRAKAAGSALDENLISSGLYRSGIRVRGREDIQRGAAGDYSTGVNSLLQAQAQARYQGQLDALDRAQKWLDDKRQYLLATEDNQIKLKVGLAQIQLGYAKLASDKELLQMQIAAQPRSTGPTDIQVLAGLFG